MKNIVISFICFFIVSTICISQQNVINNNHPVLNYDLINSFKMALDQETIEKISLDLLTSELNGETPIAYIEGYYILPIDLSKVLANKEVLKSINIASGNKLMIKELIKDVNSRAEIVELPKIKKSYLTEKNVESYPSKEDLLVWAFVPEKVSKEINLANTQSFKDEVITRKTPILNGTTNSIVIIIDEVNYINATLINKLIGLKGVMNTSITNEKLIDIASIDLSSQLENNINDESNIEYHFPSNIILNANQFSVSDSAIIVNNLIINYVLFHNSYIKQSHNLVSLSKGTSISLMISRGRFSQPLWEGVPNMCIAWCDIHLEACLNRCEWEIGYDDCLNCQIDHLRCILFRCRY